MPTLPTFSVQKRSVALLTVISLVTCGIGFVVWCYLLSSDLQKMRKEAGAPEPSSGESMKDLMLCVLTLGVYWFYMLGSRYEDLEKRVTGRPTPLAPWGLLHVLMAFIGIPFVTPMLLQFQINSILSGKLPANLPVHLNDAPKNLHSVFKAANARSRGGEYHGAPIPSRNQASQWESLSSDAISRQIPQTSQSGFREFSDAPMSTGAGVQEWQESSSFVTGPDSKGAPFPTDSSSEGAAFSPHSSPSGEESIDDMLARLHGTLNDNPDDGRQDI